MKTDFYVRHNLNLLKSYILRGRKISGYWFLGIILCSLLSSPAVNAQVTPDGSTSTTVDANGNDFTINEGDRAGDNLFHSFDDFSVPTGGSAVFNNADDIVNIFSRVTGGNISNIDGLLQARDTANLFLVNPAGIIFGSNARLDVGGSFLGSTADSILFEDGEFSASNLDTPVLTVNAPIGLNFRDEPGDITNSSLDTVEFIGLKVPEDRTIGLIGGDVFIEEGLISTPGRIELGSVGENSRVSLTEVEKGWDIGYEEVANFGTIELSGGAFVTTETANTGDIEVQGSNIALAEGSQIGITTETGQAGNLTIIASESLSLDGNGIEVGIGNFATSLFNNISGEATGEESQININTPQLTLSNGARINALVFPQDRDPVTTQGVDIVINADDVVVETPFIINESSLFRPGIFAAVLPNSSGNNGSIIIETDTLALNEGGQISSDTFGTGNAGDLTVNASESIKLIGTISLESNDPSGLFVNVGESVTATGNGGNLTINTARLFARDGAQIGTVARNQGDGGTVTVNASESILFTGTAPVAGLQGGGRSGISVSVQPSFEDSDSSEIIPTVGDGGAVNLTTEELTIEQGAQISINTFSTGDGGDGNINVDRLVLREGGQIGAGSLIGANSLDPEADRGNGGTLNINASESVEILGTGSINDEVVNSSIFTLAESTGDAGSLTLTTDNLLINDGGEINVSAIATGSAGNLTVDANSLDLDRGTLNADTAAGTGGNIRLKIDNNISLDRNSLISAAATGLANGGNIDIDAEFIIASPDSNSDILASAGRSGTGGRISIDAESVFGLQVRPQSDLTNDLNASGGVDGEIIINTPDTDITGGLIEVPQNIIESERITAQACSRDRQTSSENALIVNGRGGVAPTPDRPLNSQNIIGEGESATSPNASAIQFSTSRGAIIPARGAIKTEDGRVILTAYSTNAVNDDTSQTLINCEMY